MFFINFIAISSKEQYDILFFIVNDNFNFADVLLVSRFRFLD
jgi:hypothetical protein